MKEVKCDWCYKETKAIAKIKIRHVLDPKKFIVANVCGRHKFEIALAYTKDKGSKIIKVYDKEKLLKVIEKIKKEYKWVKNLLEIKEYEQKNKGGKEWIRK